MYRYARDAPAVRGILGKGRHVAARDDYISYLIDWMAVWLAVWLIALEATEKMVQQSEYLIVWTVLPCTTLPI